MLTKNGRFSLPWSLKGKAKRQKDATILVLNSGRQRLTHEVESPIESQKSGVLDAPTMSKQAPAASRPSDSEQAGRTDRSGLPKQSDQSTALDTAGDSGGGGSSSSGSSSSGSSSSSSASAPGEPDAQASLERYRHAKAAALSAMAGHSDRFDRQDRSIAFQDDLGAAIRDHDLDLGLGLGGNRVTTSRRTRPTTRSTTNATPRSSIVNAFSVDVEDWFQVAGFADFIAPSQWPQLPSRLDRNLDLMLRLLDRHRVKASFFVSGWMVDRYPMRIREIARLGHEIGSRGLSHQRIADLGPERLREELTKIREQLENLTGRPVIGYRAADFSLTRDTPWAHEVIAECGYQYSSSVFPITHDRYGMPGAPRFPYLPCERLLEIPPSTFHALGQTLPAGGGYFRLYPYALTAWALRRINAAERSPAVFYSHLWALDVRQPRVRNATLSARMRHYTNLDRTLLRLDRLLREFRWGPISQVFGPNLRAIRSPVRTSEPDNP